MKNRDSFELPVAFLDLSTIIMVTFILITVALATAARQEYQTQVDLLTKQTQQGSGAGTETVSLAITGGGQKDYSFTLESKTNGIQKLVDIKSVITELKNLSPPSLLLRIDKTAEFGYPQQIMIAAYEQGIQIGFAFIREE